MRDSEAVQARVEEWLASIDPADLASADAVTRAASLRSVAKAVEMARAEGVTWTEIRAVVGAVHGLEGEGDRDRQQSEREIAAGNVRRFDTGEDAVKWLQADNLTLDELIEAVQSACHSAAIEVEVHELEPSVSGWVRNGETSPLSRLVRRLRSHGLLNELRDSEDDSDG